MDKSTLKCTHCQKTGHMKNKCFELVGCPDQSDHNRSEKSPKRLSTATAIATKIEDGVTKQASTLVISSNNDGKALNISTLVSHNTWIIDSGATNHMTFDSRQISQINSSNQKVISIANGTTTPIIGEGSLTLTDTLNLHIVLFVPSLEYNIFSASQITTTLSCVVIFWPNFCVFKDIKMRKVIGCGIREGSYITWTQNHRALKDSYKL